MKSLFPAALAAAFLAGCGGPDKYAENAAVPNLAVTSETPGDWSQLRHMVGRTPDESGLLQESAITVDLNALLGREAERFRVAMAGANPLTQDGAAFVTVGRSRQAFLVIVPADHALLAGLKSGGGWRTFRTPGANTILPGSVAPLLRT